MEFQYKTKNEPVREYRPNSKEKQSLLDEYHRMANQIIEIPIIKFNKCCPLKVIGAPVIIP